jgi:hypothetical protein
MLTTLTLGLASSIVAELINWLNLKLTNTIFRGRGAFILAAVVALVGGAIKTWSNGFGLTNFHAFSISFAEIWTVSQGFFVFVVETFHLDVQPPTTG